MDISPIHRNVKADEVPTERLAQNSQLTEEQKIGEAARQFEAMLLRQILENTQKTVIHSKFSDDNSTSASIYRDLAVTQLADSISKSGDFGLARTLEKQFQRPTHAESKAEHHLTTEFNSLTSSRPLKLSDPAP